MRGRARGAGGGVGWSGGKGRQAGAYETQASTLWTLVVKERSLTSSELAMYRGSLSSHACAAEAGYQVGAAPHVHAMPTWHVQPRALRAHAARAAPHPHPPPHPPPNPNP